MKRLLALSLLLAAAVAAAADGPKDNIPSNVRPVPPVGITLEQADHEELSNGLAKLNKKLAMLKKADDEFMSSLLPDVEIFSRAIRDGIAHRELFSKRNVSDAKKVLAEGHERADALLTGKAPWTRSTGLIVRGFRSKIDQTVQPYGLVIPESYSFSGPAKFRLDLWFHGRGERSSEAVFINERMTKVGRYAPADTIVLHPYGRYSNAFKFAGEIDVLEALQHAQQHYRVDEDRISVRGFSMGGAGCWQMAVHYPSLFFAANPGAGFSETPEFLNFFQKETLNPTWYERKLWRMYDCTGYADNLFNLPTIAYSGELDIQRQAADIMETTLRTRGMQLTHIIGPDTKHTIHPDSMKLIEGKMDNLAVLGRIRRPPRVKLTTYTLKYNHIHWLRITGLKQHWEQASVVAGVALGNVLNVQATGVTELTFRFPAGELPFSVLAPVRIRMIAPGKQSDGARRTAIENDLVAQHPGTDRSWECTIHHDGEAWQIGPLPSNGLRKRHDLQGPIDDAFMDSFIVVKPSGSANHEKVDDWTKSELNHFVREWRRQFRGDAIVKLDSDVTPEDIESSNLVLFGDPASNQILKSIMGELPIQWSASNLSVNGDSYDPANHAPVMIYPNPKNPERYVVLNSGFTYREYAYLNNARQVPKLPDWAVINLDSPANALWPGKVVDADFFDESWNLKSRN